MHSVARSSTSISGSDRDHAMLAPAQVSPFLLHKRSKFSHGVHQARPLKAGKSHDTPDVEAGAGWCAHPHIPHTGSSSLTHCTGDQWCDCLSHLTQE